MSAPSTLRTPLGRVRGLGAAHGGTWHHIASRVSGAALLLLLPWFAVSAALTLRSGYDAAFAWVRQPANGVLLSLLILTAAHHSAGGVQVVIEDYIHKHGSKVLLLILNLFAHAALAAAGVYAVLRISFGS